MLTLPASFVADVTTSVGTTFANLAPFIVPILALPIVFWLAKRIFGLAPKAK